MQKIQKFLKFLVVIMIAGIIILEIPTIADWGDYESYDSSSSYDDWGSSSSSDWGSSSSSDWGSSSWDYDDDDYYYRSGSRYRSNSSPIFISSGSFGFFVIIVIIVLFAIYLNRKGSNNYYKSKYGPRSARNLRNQDFAINQKRIQKREALFGVSDKQIEDSIQLDDPLFNKAEFLSWAGDMFVKLQYAWSDRNLEEIRYFVTPELFEQTNSQVQRYIANKQVNKLERVSVNLSRLYSYDKQGDREILRVVLESKMVDYIIQEQSGIVIKGSKDEDVINPYILTFVRKAGVKTEAGEIKPVTMNCPNCGGATTILSSGKCPYCRKHNNYKR